VNFDYYLEERLNSVFELSILFASGDSDFSSFQEGIGNLLTEDFISIWSRREARYWRNKEFLPPGCKDCDLADLCCGACPLYWDEQGTFGEIAPYLKRTSAWEQLAWRLKRRALGRVKGVGLQGNGRGRE